MGLFGKKKPRAPRLYEGRLIEVQLRPKEGMFPERDHVLGPRGRRNFWCDLVTGTVASGKYAGSTRVDIVVSPEDERTKYKIGHLLPEQMVDDAALVEALNSGINAATVLLSRDGRDGEVTAILRLGNHQYMPKPYWT